MAIEGLGGNVRRHMKFRGFTVPELARRAEMSTPALSNLLNGKADPRSSTLINLARALEVPVGKLIEAQPELKSVRFRTAKTLSGREKAERDQLRNDTAIWLSNFAFLEEELGDRMSYKLKGMRFGSPGAAARKVRKELVCDAVSPIADIAHLVEEAGIKLRIHPFGFKKTFGLSIGIDDKGPAIVVNSESGISIERQIFTVAHELGHLVLHPRSYGLERQEENDTEEAEANLFAGNFLLPEESLKAEWEQQSGRNWIKSVLHIKRKYKVSYLTVLVRLKQVYPGYANLLLEREFANEFKRLYNHDLKNHYEPDALETMVAEKEYPDSLSENDFVEDRFSRLIREAYEAERISLSRAAEMRNYSIEEMRDLVRMWQAMSGKKESV